MDFIISMGIKDFEIAGEDEIFYEAQAKFWGVIIVESFYVSNPRKVRYGWKNYFEASLFNIEGLPATSFYITFNKIILLNLLFHN